MTQITIRERKGDQPVVVFDGGEEYPITIADPFSAKEEARLEWYFEQHLQFPFTDQVRAKEAAASVTVYGEALFKQVFADPDAYARYKETLQSGIENLSFEVSGSPDFHHLHWEALKDPRLPQPLALQAPMVRRNLTPQTVRARVLPSPTINLLIVTARPSGIRDVGYRTISRPLVEGLRQADLHVQVEILRPGTYRALVDHLEAVQDKHGTSYYHVIHFDTHGALLTYEQLKADVEANQLSFQARYGRADIEPYEGLKAFLSFEGDQEGQSDLVEARELGDLLLAHQIPITILNACQSGKQVGAEGSEQQGEVRETSLGSRLMAAGVQMVLAMGYSVTVSAAELVMKTLYLQLFGGSDIASAIRRARLELYNQKGRRAYYNQEIDLEDWLLPVVYQNQAQQLEVRAFTPEENAAFYERQAQRYQPPEVIYGFVGRDLDILRIERRLLTRRNILLARGMGGAGKTTLLHHLAGWWQTTGLVERVWYFGYDERAWNRQQIMVAIAQDLLSKAEYVTNFEPLSAAAQQALLCERLRGERHLVVLDNLESITGSHLAVLNTLTEDEREELKAFVAGLAGGRSLVLLGSRGGEEWLAEGTFGDSVYNLGGLDPEAASTLAERILERHGASKYREDEDLQHLLKLLAGYPLALEVVLGNLVRQTPEEVFAALQAGDEGIDLRSEDKTESILRCIDYSHANLSPDAQQLLACLAPFSAICNTDMLPLYVKKLQGQRELAELPFERWEEVLGEAIGWGLLSPDAQFPKFLRLQPTLPYFLRSRLSVPEQDGVRRAIETAFRELYSVIGAAIMRLQGSREPQTRHLGQIMAQLEYENLLTALRLALAAQVSVMEYYDVLWEYLYAAQDHRRGLALGEMVLARLENYPPEALSGSIEFALLDVRSDIAECLMELKQYSAVEASHRKTLAQVSLLQGIDAVERKKLMAPIYHQLGRVTQEQRQWTQAEGYYRQALDIFLELDNRHDQAGTYHQLGLIAQGQRQWEQAERYYGQALDIFLELEDRHLQASTYYQLGRVAGEQRQWEQAERYYRQALDIFLEFDDVYKQAATYHQLGMMAGEQRQWQQAEGYYRQALDLRIKFKNRYEQALTYHQMGTLAQRQGQLEQAERYYQQALDIKIEFKDRFGQASTYHQLGSVAEEQRQWQQAEGYYRQALDIYNEFNERHEQAKTYHQMGTLARRQGRWEQAEMYYQQALDIKIEFKDRFGQAPTYYQLGIVAQEQQLWKRAQEHMLKSLALVAEFEDMDVLTIIIYRLSRLWRESGSATLPPAVAEILNISLQEAEDLLRSGGPDKGEDTGEDE